jgi:hypothetical protein
LLNVAVKTAILAHNLDEQIGFGVGGGALDTHIGIVPSASVRRENGEANEKSYAKG